MLKCDFNKVALQRRVKTQVNEFVWGGRTIYLCIHVSCAPAVSTILICFDATYYNYS